MLKKILIAGATLASTSIAFAGTMGSVVPAYTFLTGPYIGASIGSQTNTVGLPAAYKGLAGTLSGGWGTLFNQRFYLAAEVFGGSNARLRNDPLGGLSTGSISSSWNYGGDIIPGFLLNDRFLAYARGGVIQTNFNDVDVQRTGWQAGVGGQTNFYRNLDLRAEYIYSQFSSIAGVGTPRIDLFNVGLVYKFV